MPWRSASRSRSVSMGPDPSNLDNRVSRLPPSLRDAENRGDAASMVAAARRLGVIGPAAFTAAWVTSTVRQTGYSIAEEHLSGLAAPDARDPGIMIAGFVTLGACTTAFASALE